MSISISFMFVLSAFFVLTGQNAVSEGLSRDRSGCKAISTPDDGTTDLSMGADNDQGLERNWNDDHRYTYQDPNGGHPEADRPDREAPQRPDRERNVRDEQGETKIGAQVPETSLPPEVSVASPAPHDVVMDEGPRLPDVGGSLEPQSPLEDLSPGKNFDDLAPPVPGTLSMVVSGNVTTQTWTKAGGPYYINGYVLVPRGNTLTIQAGAQVIFNGSWWLSVEGNLEVKGSPTDMVVFKSNKASPAPGDWRNIRFNSTGKGNISYAEVKHCNYAFMLGHNDGHIMIDHCFMHNISTYGVWATRGGFMVNSSVINSTQNAVYIDISYSGQSKVRIGDIDFLNNTVLSARGVGMAAMRVQNVQANVDVAIGNFTGVNNRFLRPLLGSGFYLNNMGVENLGNGTVSCGDQTIYNNSIFNTAASGVYHSARAANLYNVSVSIGDLNISRNTVKASTARGFDIKWWQFQNLLNDTAVSVGTTIIDKNNVTCTTEGVFVDYNVVGYTMKDQASLSIGPASVSGNRIVTPNIGVYFEIYDLATWMWNSTDFDMDTIVIAGNTITSGLDCIVLKIDDSIRQMYGRSKATLGSVHIEDNILTVTGSSTAKAIHTRIDVVGAYMYGDSKFVGKTWNITDNEIDSDSMGISCNIQFLGYQNSARSSVDFGELCVRDNTVAASDGPGIEVILFFIGNQNIDNSTVRTGWVAIYDNNVDVDSGLALYLVLSDLGIDLEDDAMVDLGDVSASYNYLVGPSSAAEVVIMNLGNQMYDRSCFSVGDILLSGNDLFSTGGNGFNIPYYYQIGYDIYDESRVSMGTLSITGNDFDVPDGSIALAEFGENAYLIHDNANVQLGGIDIDGNTQYRGWNFISIYSKPWASWMGTNCSVYMGLWSITDNDVNCTGEVVYIDLLRQVGTNLTGTSSLAWEGIYVGNNVMTWVAWRGIYARMGYIGSYLYDNSSVEIGGFAFEGNDLNASLYGIDVIMNYFGYDLYNDSSSSIGDLQIVNNTMLTGKVTGMGLNDGIYVDYYRNGYYLYHRSTASLGGLEVSGNDVYCKESYGIHVFRFEELGEYLYGASSASLGDLLVEDNIIDSKKDGIYLHWIWFVGYRIYDDASAWFEDMRVDGNDITTGGTGIYTEVMEYFGSEMEDNAQAHFGNFTFNKNTIDCVGSSGQGIDFSYGPCQYFANIIYDQANCTYGNIEICENDIEALGTGISMSNGIYESGYEMHGTTSAAFGDFLICNNTVTAQDTGIDFDIISLGYYLYDDSSMEFGDIRVNDNTVDGPSGTELSGDGIYLSGEYIGLGMEDSARMVMGDAEVCRNHVNKVGYYGIYYEASSIGYDVYERTSFTQGDTYIDHNKVEQAGNDGLHFDMYSLGCNVDGTSKVKFGSAYVTYNEVNSTGEDGLEAWWGDYSADDVEDMATVSVGDLYVMHNTARTSIPSGGWYPNALCSGMDNFGTYITGHAQAFLGDVYITDNTLFCNDTAEAAEIIYEKLGYDMVASSFPECYANVSVGELHFSRNTINAPKAGGISLVSSVGAGRLLDNLACVKTGGIFIEDNTIDCRYEGIVVWLNNLGENTWYDSRADIGPLTIRGNTVTNDEKTCIKLQMSTCGNAVHGDSVVSIGDVTVADNTVNSPKGVGIGVGMDFLASTFDHGNLTMGCINITGNDVTAYKTGIDVIYWSSMSIMHLSTANISALNILDNVVATNGGALNVTITATPSFVEPSAHLNWVDIHIEGNDLDGGSHGAVFEWQKTPVSKDQPGLVLDTNDIHSGQFKDSMGLTLRNWAGVWITDTDVRSFDNGTYINNTSVWTWTNGSISSIADLDVNLTKGSFLHTLNTTFNQASVHFEDDVSLLEVAWFMNAEVRTQTSQPVAAASVTVKDVGTYTVFDSKTDANGRAYYIICKDYQEDATGMIISYNDHTASAIKGGISGSASPNPTMDQTKVVQIMLTDTVPPQLLTDLSDTAGTTGDPFLFRATASDNLGVDLIRAYYRPGPSGPYTQVDLAPEGDGTTFRVSADAPHYVPDMQYYLVVFDIAGLNFTGTPVTVPIADNDAPDSITDHSPAAATTSPFRFNMTASDNIGVTQASALYWTDGAGLRNLTLNGTSGAWWAENGLLDYAPSANLNYRFGAADAAGNWYWCPQKAIPLSDDLPPVIVADNSDTAAAMGVDHAFRATVLDDFGVEGVQVLYWFGADTAGADNATMAAGTGPDAYQFTITVPADVYASLYYRFTAVDAAGNWAVSPNNSVCVRDTVRPIVGFTSPAVGAMVRGNVTLGVTATDTHSGIARIEVRAIASPAPILFYNATPATAGFSASFNTTQVPDGICNFTATAFDVDGNNASASRVLTVDNTPPKAEAGPNKTVQAGSRVAFDGGLSSDANGITAYTWSFDYEGATVTLSEVKVNHTFAEPGVYAVTLTATDAAGNHGTDITYVTVNPSALPRPKIVRTVPANGTTGVTIDTTVTIEFDLEMAPATVEAAIAVLPAVPFTTSWSSGNKTVELVFASPLDQETEYTVTVGAGAMAVSGEALLGAPYRFVFTTEAAPSLTILTPPPGKEFAPGASFVVSGTSKHLPQGTDVIVMLDNVTYLATVGADGTWSVTVKAPSEGGSYTVMVTAAGISKSTDITVTQASDDDDDTDFLGSTLFYIIMAVALALLVIVIIVVFMMRRKGAPEQGAEKEEGEEEEEEDDEKEEEGEEEGDEAEEEE